MNQTHNHTDDFYAAVPEPKRKRLMQFRTYHAPKKHDIDGHIWSVITGGGGDDCVLLLHGGGGDAETMFKYIEGLGRHYFVIAPNIPPTLRTTADVISGLHAILAQYDVQRCHVVGTSFGGLLAQLFVRRFPHQVQDMVLSHTRIPTQRIAQRTAMQRAFVRLYPSPVLRRLMHRSMKKALESPIIPISNGERLFWLAYFDEWYQTRFQKRLLVARVHLSYDYYAHHQFKPSDLDDWPGRILIIESDADDVIDEGSRGEILGMYPRAYLQQLTQTSHLTPLFAGDELAASVLKFLTNERLT